MSDPRGARPLDLVVTGTVFLDLILTGLRAAPVGGREIMADGMGSSPGGAATLAVAASRLGVATGLVAAFGSDVYGDFCWSTLEDDEGVDLSASRRLEGWHSPVTVSLAYDDDRAMITHAHQPPIEPDELFGHVPEAAVCFADVGTTRAPWVDGVVERGSLVFADVGWDDTGAWDAAGLRERLEGCHAFVPNAAEAMAYTGKDHPGAALEVIRDWVPLAVVTAGSGGAYAADDRTGETVWVPGLRVPAIDPTGAGDVFLAALMAGTLRGLAPAAAHPVRQPRRRALGARRRRRARRPGLGRRLRLVDRPRPGQPPAARLRLPRGRAGRGRAPHVRPGGADDRLRQRHPRPLPARPAPRARRLRAPGAPPTTPPDRGARPADRPARPATPSRRPPPPLRRTDDPHPSASHPRRRPGRHRPARDHRRLRPRRGGRQRHRDAVRGRHHRHQRGRRRDPHRVGPGGPRRPGRADRRAQRGLHGGVPERHDRPHQAVLHRPAAHAAQRHHLRRRPGRRPGQQRPHRHGRLRRQRPAAVARRLRGGLRLDRALPRVGALAWPATATTAPPSARAASTACPRSASSSVSSTTRASSRSSASRCRRPPPTSRRRWPPRRTPASCRSSSATSTAGPASTTSASCTTSSSPRDDIRNLGFGREGASWTSEENVQAAQTFSEWVGADYFTPDFNGVGYDPAWQDFAQGNGRLPRRRHLAAGRPRRRDGRGRRLLPAPGGRERRARRDRRHRAAVLDHRGLRRRRRGRGLHRLHHQRRGHADDPGRREPAGRRRVVRGCRGCGGRGARRLDHRRRGGRARALPRLRHAGLLRPASPRRCRSWAPGRCPTTSSSAPSRRSTPPSSRASDAVPVTTSG